MTIFVAGTSSEYAKHFLILFNLLSGEHAEKRISYNLKPKMASDSYHATKGAEMRSKHHLLQCC